MRKQVVSTGYDYIVVGAGSAGAIVASRLAENPDASVLLLEAGPAGRSMFIDMPAAVGTLLRHRWFNWDYFTEPQPKLFNRRIWTPRGKVLGGSSALNGMAYIRGHALDYERWAQEGATGWSYSEVLPYFRALESHQDRCDEYHGNDGPVAVVTGKCANPLFGAFIEAGLQAGYSYTSDVNGRQQEGFGRYDMNVDRGRRARTSRAYLSSPPQNLEILTGALAERILFTGTAAHGVSYVRKGERKTVYAGKEIIVCAGAINSPKLLLASGIGPATDLRELGVTPIVNAPEVGRNLQDHLEVLVEYRCRKPITLYGNLRPWRKPWIGAQWLLSKNGMGATNHCEAGAFIRSGPGIEHPDVQYHFVPICSAGSDAGSPREHGYRIHAGTLRSQSRGTVKLRSTDATAAPIIDPNYMATAADWREMRACVRFGCEVFEQSAFKEFNGGPLRPGPDVRSDTEMDDFIRAEGTTAFHPSGTCRMGSDDRSVVDPQCRVRGVEQLRVVDASIMPSIVSGNLNAPTMMIGEKAAAMIAGRPPLGPAASRYTIRDGWQKAQR